MTTAGGLIGTFPGSRPRLPSVQATVLPSFRLLMKAQSQNLLRAIKMPFDPECLFLRNNLRDGIVKGRSHMQKDAR